MYWETLEECDKDKRILYAILYILVTAYGHLFVKCHPLR